MHGVDGRHGHDDESNSTVTHCLVLGGANGEDQKTECVVSSILVDNGSVGVELYGCSFDFLYVGSSFDWLRGAILGCRNSAL